MGINWKLRLQNKATLTALLLALVAFVYQVLGIAGIVPGISQDTATEIVAILVNVLLAIGVVVDPTTSGVSDSKAALSYDEPKEG